MGRSESFKICIYKDSWRDKDDIKTGIPLKDEFKLKLPMVLDGNHSLQFSLFSVDLQDDIDI